jgi:probable phosphoglycerate mutase
VDLPLSSKGIRQAEGLREKLRDTRLTAIYCSDLKRSRGTAEIIAKPHGMKPQPLTELREIHLGEWEGMDFDQVRRKFPGQFEARGLNIVHYRTPEGESFQDCALRVIPTLYNILHSTRGDILIVGHAGINRIILSQAMGTDMKDLFKIRQEYGCLDRISYDDHRFSMD